MSNNHLVINNCTDPYYNLALEEYLLLNRAEGTLVMLWQNDNTIVVGRNQNTYEEINRELEGHLRRFAAREPEQMDIKFITPSRYEHAIR